MVHRRVATAVVLGALVLAASLDAQTDRRRGRGRDRRPPPELQHLTYAEKTFDSEAVGKEMSYGVFLPKDYDAAGNAEKEYPLVLWLHGLNEDHGRFHRRGGAEVLDRLVGDGTFPPSVFVTADGDRRSFWIDAAGVENARYETLVTEDLLGHVEETYRVADDRRQRAIAGVSMGGYGALKIALRHPELFGAVAAHSAAILPKDPARLIEEYPWLERRGSSQLAELFGDPLDEDKWREENVMAIAEGLDKADLDGLRIYFDVGSADRYGFQDPNVALHELLEQKDIPHTFRLVEGGNHGWGSGYNQEALPHALEFLASVFAAREGQRALEGLLGPGRGDGKAP